MSGQFRTVYAFAREMHPKNVKGEIQYGTAGFRTKGINLDYVLFRMGLLAVLRARVKKAIIGIMITASHNPESDNGVKLVDPHGEMLEQSWEKLATKMANVPDEELEHVVSELVHKYEIDMNLHAGIYIGKDTRPSSVKLSKAAIDGILALKGKPFDFGIVTTPMLHYFVTCKNTNGAYGEPTEEGYYNKLVSSFKKLRGTDYDKEKYIAHLYYDGANGVGAKKIKNFQEMLGDCLKIEDFNNAIIGSGKLNYMCGADHVKVQQVAPEGVPREPNVRCVSVDGDADRIVYYYIDENDQFHLLDGDRIATLIASYLMDLVKNSKLHLELGLIQTAYANGGSTAYIATDLKIPIACVPTGVKHLHHKALEYDIGVYFEANGHGTVVFSKNAKNKISSAANDTSLNETQRKAATELLTVIDVINETVGDAISDMLLVETILHARGWDLKQWESTYVDLPNKQLKVQVKDRNIITTTDAERKCVTPVELQLEIDLLVKKYNKARAFVRPSGTEDIVRVYAEAANREDCDKLALEIALKVHQLAGGIGEPPALSN